MDARTYRGTYSHSASAVPSVLSMIKHSPREPVSPQPMVRAGYYNKQYLPPRGAALVTIDASNHQLCYDYAEDLLLRPPQKVTIPDPDGIERAYLYKEFRSAHGMQAVEHGFRALGNNATANSLPRRPWSVISMGLAQSDPISSACYSL